ncbi:hypothetical protein Dsin_009377 [Dipteronia sinensis]|uniref:Uncharacterized protein n=1 Tax=Dipteronia sinensis TaxID=43782 RepID=A0AAE0EC19_9ROSI|nr:hypothetical protein Dsin_009377 [Dipteronia sinensis]
MFQQLIPINYAGYVIDVEKSVVKNGYFTGNDTSHDDCSDDVCTNYAPTCSSSVSLLDRRFVIGVLKFCSNERCFELGKRYHALIIKSEVSVNQFVETSRVGMFAKCGDMSLLVARLTPDFVNLTPVY